MATVARAAIWNTIRKPSQPAVAAGCQRRGAATTAPAAARPPMAATGHKERPRAAGDGEAADAGHREQVAPLREREIAVDAVEVVLQMDAGEHGQGRQQQ